MKIKLNSYLLLCIALITGCQHKTSLEQHAYVQLLNSSKCELTTARVLNKISYTCKLQTPDLLTLINHGKSYSNVKEFNADKKNYEDQLNFVFLIGDETPSDHLIKETVFNKEAYSRLLSYANSELQNDFEIQLPDGQTIPCSVSHVEAANSIQPVIRIAVAFSNVNTKLKDYTLIFDDNLFNSGKIKFHFGREIFDDLPLLNI